MALETRLELVCTVEDPCKENLCTIQTPCLRIQTEEEKLHQLKLEDAKSSKSGSEKKKANPTPSNASDPLDVLEKGLGSPRNTSTKNLDKESARKNKKVCQSKKINDFFLSKNN